MSAPPCQNLNIYTAASTRFSPIHHAGVFNTTSLSPAMSSEQLPGVRKAGGTHILSTGESVRSLWSPRSSSQVSWQSCPLMTFFHRVIQHGLKDQSTGLKGISRSVRDAIGWAYGFQKIIIGINIEGSQFWIMGPVWTWGALGINTSLESKDWFRNPEDIYSVLKLLAKGMSQEKEVTGINFRKSSAALCIPEIGKKALLISL